MFPFFILLLFSLGVAQPNVSFYSEVNDAYKTYYGVGVGGLTNIGTRHYVGFEIVVKANYDETAHVDPTLLYFYNKFMLGGKANISQVDFKAPAATIKGVVFLGFMFDANACLFRPSLFYNFTDKRYGLQVSLLRFLEF